MVGYGLKQVCHPGVAGTYLWNHLLKSFNIFAVSPKLHNSQILQQGMGRYPTTILYENANRVGIQQSGFNQIGTPTNKVCFPSEEILDQECLSHLTDQPDTSQSTFFSRVWTGLPGLNQYYTEDKVSCSRTHCIASGEAPTCNPSISRQALYQSEPPRSSVCIPSLHANLNLSQTPAHLK